MTERSGHDLLKSMAALGFVAIIGTALLAGVYELTRDRIQEQERRAVLDQLQQIIPPEAYDNALFTHGWQLIIPGATIALTVIAFNAI